MASTVIASVVTNTEQSADDVRNAWTVHEELVRITVEVNRHT